MDASLAQPPVKTPQMMPLMLALSVTILAGFALSNSDFADVLISTVADAYLQVTTFVAATLLLFYGIERLFGIDAIRLLSRSGFWQVPLAAALGALPGCGGAIIVVTNFVSGRLSFGAVMATLTATMGDAAFLLIAKEPVTGLMMMGIGLAMGTVSGYVVDALHGKHFLQGSAQNKPAETMAAYRRPASPLFTKLWVVTIIPGIIFGILGAFQVDLDEIFASTLTAEPVTLFGFVAGCLCFGMWLIPNLMRRPSTSAPRSVLQQTITDTNFVTGWVIIAFLLFEISLYVTGYELANLFDGLAIWIPLIAVVIGLLPGCGPQVLVTSLYLTGIEPLSAQIGNAISNDGDALFPALALAPKAAIIATLYSTIPALLLAYGWHFWMT